LIQTGGKSMTALEGQALLDHGKLIERRYARRIGRQAAEELRAEAILRALASPPPDGRMEPWLERIYRNLTVDLWRRAGHWGAGGEGTDDLTADNTPEEEALRRERRRIVRAALRDLPRDARRALLAKYYAEHADDATAARFGVAAATVRTRIHRALARLRTRLGELRAYLPPLFGRMGSQLVAVGAAPAMVASLLVVANVPAATETRLAPAASAAVAAVVARSAESEILPPLSRPSPPALGRVSKRAPSKAPATQSSTVVASDASVLVVAHIESPDALMVFADPDPPALPCMVAAPTSFAAQIAEMIEEAN
jgi:RNA polymerase sigma factor (sigma-70 family)